MASAQDIHVCPAGKTLTTTGTLVNDGATLLYLARKHDCDRCALKARCCPKAPLRKIPRNQHEGACDVARSLVGTEGFEQSRRDRKRIEMRFAHLKRILRLGRLRLRGPRGAQDEFVLAAIAQNLRRLAKLLAHPPSVADSARHAGRFRIAGGRDHPGLHQLSGVRNGGDETRDRWPAGDYDQRPV
jgi:hypothetical protein